MQNAVLLILAGATAVGNARNTFMGRDLQQYGGYGYGYGYSPEQPDIYSPEQPAYSPEQPVYSPEVPAYSPSVPAYSPSIPAYSPSPVYSPRGGYSPETAYSPVLVLSPETAYSPSPYPAYSPTSDILSPSIETASPSIAPASSPLPSDETEMTLESLAECFDYNGDGVLDLQDIKDTVQAQVSDSDIHTFVTYIDSNGDGKVTFDEVVEKVHLALSTLTVPDEFVTLLDQIDLESLCGITTDEVLLALMGLISEDHNQLLLTVFNVLDINDDGLVPITSIVDTLQKASTPQDILNIITAMDANADGVISETEFKQYISSNDVVQKLVDWYNNNF